MLLININLFTLNLMSTPKETIHNNCLQLIDEKIERLNSIIQSAQDASNNETKSSAGDKFETARAMMQAEKDKAGMQLQEAFKMKSVLDQIDRKNLSKEVKLGSLVQTTLGLFYLSIALGDIINSKIKCFAISPVSPVGQKMKGMK